MTSTCEQKGSYILDQAAIQVANTPKMPLEYVDCAHNHGG